MREAIATLDHFFWLGDARALKNIGPDIRAIAEDTTTASRESTAIKYASLSTPAPEFPDVTFLEYSKKRGKIGSKHSRNGLIRWEAVLDVAKKTKKLFGKGKA
jgi:hypothetical protein